MFYERDGEVASESATAETRERWGTMLELRPRAMPRSELAANRTAFGRRVSGPPTMLAVPESSRTRRTNPRREFEQLLAAGQLELAAERFLTAVLSAGLAATFADWASGVASQPTEETAAASKLTRRERDVVTRIAAGLTNRAIADELFIAQSTVERHVANVLNKLGFHSRTQIAAWAVRVKLAGA